MSLIIRTSGVISDLPSRERNHYLHLLAAFTDRFSDRFPIGELHVHMKRGRLVECTVNLFTDRGRFHTEEHSYEVEEALKSCLASLRAQLEQHADVAREVTIS